MCGITGYIGKDNAVSHLIHGLSKLEYRGYDSAGIAFREFGKNNFEIYKAKGKLINLEEKLNGLKDLKDSMGIGHTRWATHGQPTEINAHPHFSEDNRVVLVHNGIIENYSNIKKELENEGYTFYSETDTEVACKLIDKFFLEEKEPLKAISKAMGLIRGSYAFAIMFKDYPDRIFAARKGSPLIIGQSIDGAFIASDVPAILDLTKYVYYIDNLELAELKKGQVTFYNIDLEKIEKELVEIKWQASQAEKAGYDHFMLKEIHEQRKALEDTLSVYLKDDKVEFSSLKDFDEKLKGLERIYVVACGSAYHAGFVGKNVIENLSDIAVEIDYASEFRYRNPKLSRNSLVVIISQSGETADSLAALRLAKEKEIPVLSIVNVVGSSIARESDYTLYTYAGPEISVATTKAYSAQLMALYLLAIESAFVNRNIDDKTYGKLISDLKELGPKIDETLKLEDKVKTLADNFKETKDVFFIGRGLDYAIGLEGSLKLKEISYIHSEAYAAGELKHGTISLIEDGTLVIAISSQKDLYEKTLSNMTEVKSRGAKLIGLTSESNKLLETISDELIYVPKTNENFMASLVVIPLQLLSYYVSKNKGFDVDKPRNLAKSVTVE